MNPNGRPPKPMARKIAEGDTHKVGKKKQQQLLKAEPKPSAGLGDCPRHLKGRARAAWNRWSEELVVMKLDKRPDVPALELACLAYARAIQAELIIEKDGPVFYEKHIDEESDEVILLKARKHPAIEIAARYSLIVKAFCSEFGFTPASRTRLVPKDAPDDQTRGDLLRLLSQPREPRKPVHVN